MLQTKRTIRKQILEYISQEKDSLANGLGDTYAEVERVRGRIQGLETALVIVEEIWEKYHGNTEDKDLLDGD